MKVMSLASLTDRVDAGDRLSRDQALALYTEAPTQLLGRLADRVRARKHPARVVTYIIDRNVNYTNICVARCNFCAFYRPVGSSDGYVLSFDEIFRKVEETIAVGGGQFLLQGGHNPDIPLQWYEDLFRAVKERYPAFRLHALSPPEVVHISRLSGLTPPQVIRRLVDAGLDSIPGGGAEILVDRVRKLLHCYGKASADEWLGVMRSAHHIGLRTTATMMYGTVETLEERLEHMFRLRELQDETGGFTAFITWSYQPEHTELSGVEATGIDYLRTLAIARLVLDNFDNLQSSWVTQGGKVGQLSLAFGANDMGSVMIEENVVRAAGASYCMDEVEIVRNIEDAGFTPKRRNMHYDILGDPFFREHPVARMTALATAKADGEAGVPLELLNYPARSRAARAARSETGEPLIMKRTMKNEKDDERGGAITVLFEFVALRWACPMRNSAMQRAFVHCASCIVHCIGPGSGLVGATEGPVGTAHRVPAVGRGVGRSLGWSNQRGWAGPRGRGRSRRARPRARSADARARQRAYAPRAVVSRWRRTSRVLLHRLDSRGHGLQARAPGSPGRANPRCGA